MSRFIISALALRKRWRDREAWISERSSKMGILSCLIIHSL